METSDSSSQKYYDEKTGNDEYECRNTENYSAVIQSMKTEFDRIVALTEKTINDNNKHIVLKYIKSLQRVTTPSQLVNYYVVKNGNKFIAVQPTSICRRKMRGGLKAEKKEFFQVGLQMRNANYENPRK